MKYDTIKQFIALREKLRLEKAALEKRLKDIQAALGGEIPVPMRAVQRKATKPPAKGKRRLSAAARAQIAARLKARWARIKKAGGKSLKAK